MAVFVNCADNIIRYQPFRTQFTLTEVAMELIKKIKESERQAQEIIDQAKAEAVKQAEEGRSRRLERLAQAEQERKKAIDAAASAAETQGLAKIEGLKEQAKNDRQQLRDKVSGKMADAAAKVMDYLRG